MRGSQPAKISGSAAVVVLTLALGIGANTAIFSVAKMPIMLRPLRAPSPTALSGSCQAGHQVPYPAVNLPTANAWLQQTNSVLEDVSAQRLDFVNLTGAPHPEADRGRTGHRHVLSSVWSNCGGGAHIHS